MSGTFRDIPALLHDARLVDCRWDHHLGTLTLCFECLRRNVDGTPIEDLRLSGVEQIATHYAPADVLVKPSEFKTDFRFALTDLEAWPYGPVEVHLAINSLQAEFESATACVRETLVGEPEVHGDESPLRVHISFEPHNYGPKAAISSLWIDCDSMEPFTNGIPLDIETWESQYKAWWTGWREHWSAKDQDDPGEREPALEETFIPAGQPDPPDLSYQPPSAAPFLLTRPTAPAELLRPIENYHTGLHERDWLKAAAAYPFFDQQNDVRASQLRDQFLGYDYGRWLYVRHIDGWWCEGNRARVIVRGIEHVMGDDDSPASNEETVIAYGLRKFRQTWVIATWRQGWPRFGSAEQLQDVQPWRDGWNLAE